MQWCGLEINALRSSVPTVSSTQTHSIYKTIECFFLWIPQSKLVVNAVQLSTYEEIFRCNFEKRASDRFRFRYATLGRHSMPDGQDYPSYDHTVDRSAITILIW